MWIITDPKFVERIEDVVFETPLITNALGNADQNKTNYRVVADNSGEASPFD